MGIKGLTAFLKKKFPSVFEPIHISEFAFEKIAVDTSLYVHIFNYLYNYENKGEAVPSWIIGILRMTAILRKNEIHPVFVYDNGSPKEKLEEQKRRREVKEKLEEKTYVLEDAIEEYNNTGEISEVLREFQKKRKIDPPLLNKSDINITQIQKAFNKMKKATYTVSKKDFELTRELFNIMEIPNILSECEGETTCADLCIQGKVKAVLGQDSDVLVYGTPVFLTKFEYGTGYCMKIEFEKLLSELNFTHSQFIDFAIMCGTDYNKNIPKIGPAKAYSLIEKYGSIEEVEKSGIDISILNHVRTREIFQNYTKTEKKVSFVGTPNFKDLETFLFKNNLTLNIDFLRKAFVREIIIDNGEGEQDKEGGEDPEAETQEKENNEKESEEEEIVLE